MEHSHRRQPRFQRQRLDSGLLVLVSENDRLPLLSLNAFVVAGADQNPLGRSGLAALTCRLLDEGTEKRTASQIAEAVENAGASLSAFSDRELSGISLDGCAADLEMGLDLVMEMLTSPIFQEDRFLLERGKVTDRIRAMDDDPRAVGTHRLNYCVYRGTPLQDPVLGTCESVAALTVDEVKTFHFQHYAPQNTVLVVVGAVRASDVFTKVAERFSNWSNDRFRRNKILVMRRQSEPILDEYSMPIEQANIFIGHLGVSRDNPDYHRLQVLDVILGGGPGFTSRIPRKLRDEQGLAYSTYSDISGSSGIYPGRFLAFISTSPENRQKALQGLLMEVESIVEKGVSKEELATAQDFLTGSFVFEFQSNSSVARFLLAAELFQLGEDYPERYPKIIGSIDCEQVHQVARQYLDTINYTTVVVGPTHGDRDGQTEEVGKNQRSNI